MWQHFILTTEAIIVLLTCVFSFNVDQKNSLSFSGPLEDMFGYTVQQFENSEGKWVLIGSPLSGQPSKRTGDVYKCPVGRDNNNCIKLELPKNTTIPNLREVKENMTMGSTLVTNPKGGFLACGPQYGYKCGLQHFISGVCANVSSSFQILNSFTKYQECGKEMDLVIVLDGSNSIYPWSSIQEFLYKFIGRLEIGPKQTQVGIVSYGETVSHQVNLSQFDNMPALRDFVQDVPQHTGTKTMTFLGIDTAREEAFMPERGARPGVKKVMVIVTDGESHDYYNLQKVIKACEDDDIERFGIAVLGDYGRQNKSLSEVQKFIKEIQNISSEPIQDHFFNVSDEAALVNIVDTLGSRILALEATSGNSTSPIQMEMSQTGFSAHTSNEGVLLGAVGAYEWNGTVVMYTAGGGVVPGKDAFFDPMKEARNERLAAYLGYDVQSASTSEGELYITGAPRYNHTGRVVIYRLDANNRIVISQILKGEQIGSYFGSVLQTVDVNKDSLTDLLLVGAPMYMGPEKDEQGRVYVYRLKNNKFEHEYTLKPINQSCCTLQSAGCTNKNEPCGARFGTAIAAVTDLNLDGYNDVAIGAPFENDHRGAVYIYHGDQKSLKEKFVQHIPAGGDGEKVKFFGQSIHGVMDLNGDGITDITIGGLGGASLFWSRDVAELYANMTFNPSKVNLQQTEHQCEHGNRKSICVKTKLCFTYRVKSDQPTVDTTANMTYTITLDSLRATSRASFISKDLKNDRRTTEKFTIMDGTKECMEKTFMMSERLDFRGPLTVSVEFGKADEEGPVLDESLPKSINANITLMDCGNKTQTCVPDLSLKADYDKQSKLIKEKEIIYLNITVKNLKDKAYNTNVKISFTQNINFVNVEPDTKTTTVNDTEVSIEVGYPFLGNNEEETITVKFEVNLKYFQKKIQFNVTATSDNEEDFSTMGDNSLYIFIPVKYELGLTFKVDVKSPLNNHIEITQDDEYPSKFSNFSMIGEEVNITYTVERLRDGVTPTLGLEVKYPFESPRKNTLLYLTNVTSSNMMCDMSKGQINPFNINPEVKEVKPKKETLSNYLLQDSHTKFESFSCLISEGKKIAQLNMAFRLWKPTFIESEFSGLYLVVNGTLDIRKLKDVFEVNSNDMTRSVSIQVSKDTVRGIPFWIIIISILIGLLILALVIFILWKLGFFKRKSRDYPKEEEAE